LRILLTVHQFLPNYSSGTEILTRDTGLEMLARGHEVHVLTVDPSVRRESIDITYEDYDYMGLKVHALRLPRRRSLPYLIEDEYDNDLVAEHVRQYAGLVKPDAVHMFHLSRLSGAVIEVFRELGVPVVFTPTDFWAICVRNTLQKPSGELSTGPDEISSNCLECQRVEELLPKEELPETTEKREFYRTIAERALARTDGEHPNMTVVRTMLARTEYLRERFNSVDAILAPTTLMRQMLTANGIDPNLITISRYGIDTSGFRDVQRSRPEPGELRIGYIGTIHSQKGLRVLLEAFAKLPRSDSVTLRVCGRLSSHPNYAVETYGLTAGDPRVNFAGSFPNERMPAELAKMDVLVVPSTWYENTPLVIYSALAAGIPVVASNLGGMAEVVRHEENGLLFEPGDAEDLARQLQRLIEEPGLLAKLGENAGTQQTVEDSVDEMLDLYARLRERVMLERDQRVSEHWARNVEARQSGEFAGNWLDSTIIQRLYINPMSTGSPDETWFPYVARTYFPTPVKRALSIGCGEGALERHALTLDVCSEFDAYDISEGSVKAAREQARDAGLLHRINYAVADLNRISLEENSYEAAFASMAIHHLENLEGVFSELTKALKPGGLFVFNEFVGPSQFQWTDTQLALANELLASIPERYRVTDEKRVLRQIRRPTIQAMNDLDPSESIRSAEIMQLAEHYFDIVERRDYGGTLLHLLTSAGTIRNYDPDDEEDVAVLRRMVDFERRHIAAGNIGSDFTLVVARNRGA
jgi:glycosyltransferase involved in cell wall biosynthesis/ubiquinone/menaquinone biosynthesis C-methylase UbiE